MTPSGFRPPLAWRMPDVEVARVARRGRHCETRRCPDPAAIVTHRWFMSPAAGRVLAAEHFACEEHGQAFAKRHRITVESAPPEGDAR